MLCSTSPPPYLGVFITVFLVTACGLKGPLRMPDQKPAANPSAPQTSSSTSRAPSQKKQHPAEQPAASGQVSQPDPARPQTAPPSP